MSIDEEEPEGQNSIMRKIKSYKPIVCEVGDPVFKTSSDSWKFAN